jgi:hypothetical protein
MKAARKYYLMFEDEYEVFDIGCMQGNIRNT